MNSMTAFSRLHVSFNEIDVIWELKSVNHRYLDQCYRLPDVFKVLEPQLRALVAKHVQRGRVEIGLQWRFQEQHLPLFDTTLLQEYLNLTQSLSQQFQLVNDIHMSHCLNLTNLWKSQEYRCSEQDYQQVLQSFEQVLMLLIQGRQQEGQALTKFLLDRVDKLEACVDKIQELSKNKSSERLQKIRDKVQQFHLSIMDNQRLEQEIVLQLMRLDIAEELERLLAHLSELRRVMIHEKNSGRRLDFLVQECHRETNTIGSKSDDIKISQLMIDMKVLIEQMREQIQNVE